MFADKLFGPVRQWGYLVKDLDQAMDSWINHLGVGPFWGFRNVQLISHGMGNMGEEQTQVSIDVGLAYQNGVQIELIQQTNPQVASPYSEFYKTTASQLFQQVGYFCTDIDQAVATANGLGLNQVGQMESAMQSRYYYFDSPALDGILIELMEVDPFTVEAFEACAVEAESWDGSDPYRLITM